MKKNARNPEIGLAHSCVGDGVASTCMVLLLIPHAREEKDQLTNEEAALLEAALRLWDKCDLFSGEQVAGVKTVFRRVFGLEDDTVLMGSVLPDAIVLQTQPGPQAEAGQGGQFFVMISPDAGEVGAERWEALEVCTEGTVCLFTKDVPFRTMLSLFDQSGARFTGVVLAADDK